MISTREQSNSPKPTEEALASVTAVSVASAYTRALAKYDAETNPEYRVATHLWEKGIQRLRGMNWVMGAGITSLPFNCQRSIFSSIIGPGYDEIIMLRKRMIKEKIVTAIENGTEQIVFLGGGYDVRALMVGLQNPNIKVFELDRGMTREAKIAGLQSLADADTFESSLADDGTLLIGTNLRYIECDVALGDLAASLTRHGYIPEKKSLFIGEGLTMYLSEADNEKLLTTISRLMSDDSECLLSFMSPRQSLGTIEQNALKNSKETYRCQLIPEQVIPFVSRSHFEVCQKRDVSDRLPELGIENPGYLRECYYLLKRKENSARLQLDDIPAIPFSIPFPKEQPSSWCVLV